MVRETDNKEAIPMIWTVIVNAFAGVAGVLSIGYLAWVAWLCVRDMPTNGRVPNWRGSRRRTARRASPWTVQHSR
jgi:hypothetical protein